MGFADFFKKLFGGDETATADDAQAPADGMNEEEAATEEAAQETMETEAEEVTEEEQGQM